MLQLGELLKPKAPADEDVPGNERRSSASEFSELFGQFLINGGLLDSAGLDRARRAAIAAGERLDRVLSNLGLVAEPVLRAALAQYFGYTIVTTRDLPAAAIRPQEISVDFVRSRQIVPLEETDHELSVAMVDPVDEEPVNALAYLMGKKISPRLIAASDFAQALQALYGDASSSAIEATDARLAEASELDIQRLRDSANEAPVIRLVNQIISTATEANASDIHIEPGADGVAVRLRLDGELHQSAKLPSGLRAAVTSRIKIMAKLDIAERRLPQDGRIKIPVSGVDVDLRISTIPTAFGESIVLRILDRSRVELDFVSLGFAADTIDAFEALTDQPNGIVLVTGPTGSGKTTTLYTALKRINKPNAKLFTVEDPIEYQIAGINQVQVHPAIDLDFPRCLRSILRQDPDIIMIGEIRDVETARIAIQSSLTGHLVFSTLHTNSATSSITRLIDMGVESYLIASTVNGILAQRLVRKLCRKCASVHPQAAQWRKRITELHPACAGQDAMKLLRPVGCGDCHETGFSGRIAIAELMILNDDVRGLIISGAPEAKIESAAREQGMRSMLRDGLEKVVAGLTTIEEVLRVTRAN